MVSGNVQIICADCKKRSTHHARGKCFDCYFREYRKTHNSIDQEVSAQILRDGDPSTWFCADCDQNPGIGWCLDESLCLDCAQKRLKSARITVRRLSHVVRQA